MKTGDLCLGAILVVLVILIVLAWRLWRRNRRDRFSYTTPATPRIREAAADLFAGITQMTALSRQFERQARSLEDASPYAGARLSAFQLTSSLCNAERALKGAPPTYANYLAVYRGLVSTNMALLNAADAYINIGHQAHQDLELGAGTALGSEGNLAEMGRTLLAMGRQLRLVVVSVHRLGVSLDVE
jgi:hypothetical protein